jgi:membrane-bound lytic murein transglycosylase D
MITKPPRPLRLAACCAAAVLVACAPRYAPPEPPPLPVPEPVREPAPEPEAEFAPEPLEPEVPTPEEEELIRDALDLVDFASFTMPVHVNEHVLAYIDAFTGRARGRFAQYLARMGRYDELIRSRITARGLPTELIYVALIESGFSPVAVSHANAVGLWQFMAGTARLEGLEIDEFIDERRDPVRATDAALQHLQRLYDRFGSWYLAAAAYNAGSGRIQRALDAGADGRTGSDSLFWQIRPLLPAETRNYVPQLIAAAIIGTHRHAFGFEGVAPAEPLSFDTVLIPDATEFAVIAEAARLDARVIAEYNTMFTRRMTPPGRRVEVRLPVGRGEAFARAYAAIPPDQRVRTHVHIVAAARAAADEVGTMSRVPTRMRSGRAMRLVAWIAATVVR